MSARPDEPPYKKPKVEENFVTDLDKYEEKLREKYNALPDIDLTQYEIGKKLGHGAYGQVISATKKDGSNTLVAIKKILLKKKPNGDHIINMESGLREINSYKKLGEHLHIVKVLQSGKSHDVRLPEIIIIMEKCQISLRKALDKLNHLEKKVPTKEIKVIVNHINSGLEYMHQHLLMHRDLTPGNVVITSAGVVKLCDLGGTREYASNLKDLTSGVVTQSYRAPEILLGFTNYNRAIDFWALGCIIGELYQGTVLFQGLPNNPPDQLSRIQQKCGLIKEQWPGVVKNMGHIQHEVLERSVLLLSQLRQEDRSDNIKSYFNYVADQTAQELVEKLLTVNPAERLDKIKVTIKSYLNDTKPTDTIKQTLAIIKESQ